MRISDWSSDVCSSDLVEERPDRVAALTDSALVDNCVAIDLDREGLRLGGIASLPTFNRGVADHQYLFVNGRPVKDRLLAGAVRGAYAELLARRSEEHTSELQSLMRISYAVFCLKKTTTTYTILHSNLSRHYYTTYNDAKTFTTP